MGTDDALATAVKSAAVEHEGRMTLACAAAFRIAESCSTTIAEVGKCCNVLGVKIVHCQLGCFK